MPLTKAQCPNCGGALEVDASKEAAVCPFCNTPYIVEKAINNYVTNVTNNIQVDTVIGEYAFYGCTGLTSVTIPESVTTIRGNAFDGCTNLRNISLLCDRNAIGLDAFANTPVANQYKAKSGCYVATCVYGSYDCPQV